MQIAVKNKLNKKESTYSPSTGLQTLVNQYKFITDEQVKISEDKNYFIVKLPLLKN